MAPSQLKQLKANLHTKRTGSDPNAKKSQTTGKNQGVKGSRSKQNPSAPWSKPRQDPKARADSIRRNTLLPALQNRHKVGGIVDRRIGENDPTMSPEERMLQRYAKQKSRRDVFNLEGGEDDDGEGLTHGGRSIMDLQADDFEDSDASADDSDGEMMVRKEKRRRSEDEEELVQDAEDQPERKRSRKEIMEEVVAKSKMHKYERQKAKDEDDDIREELDKGMGDLLAMLRERPKPTIHSSKSSAPASMEIHPDRLAQMSGDGPPPRDQAQQPRPEDLPPTPPEEEIRPPPPPVLDRKQKAEKDYDQRLRQMAQDQRAAPSERSKTVEEKAADEAARLREMEAKRLLRMRGQQVDDESDEEGGVEVEAAEEAEEDEEADEAADFGFQATSTTKKPDLDVEDEDDFVIDEDLVASGSEIDSDVSDDPEEGLSDEDEEDDSEFLKDVLPNPGGSLSKSDLVTKASQLPFTYPCPQTHEELVQVLKGIPDTELPLVIQRIRALYHPQLNASNKEKLSHFASALIDHLSYLASSKPATPLAITEQLIRHIHSLSKAYPETTSTTFRKHLSRMHNAGTIEAGDLLILTAIGTVYPTSDHFHAVVTPAITLIARWLGLTHPRTESDHRTGAYLVALALRYQSYSKRYIPETIRFTTICLESLPQYPDLTLAHIANILTMTKLWSNKSAFWEMFVPRTYLAIKRTPSASKTLIYLKTALQQARLARRPLELHHHRPLAIPSRIPRFEENFHPDRHYDPDADRAESNRLRKEHKREKKGAVRELRKDAEFVAREKYKTKKEGDAEQKKREARLVASIRSEEGREANVYEAQKRKRKGQR